MGRARGREGGENGTDKGQRMESETSQRQIVSWAHGREGGENGTDTGQRKESVATGQPETDMGQGVRERERRERDRYRSK